MQERLGVGRFSRVTVPRAAGDANTSRVPNCRDERGFCTQPFDFCHKRVTIEIGQIFVHLGFLPFLGLE